MTARLFLNGRFRDGVTRSVLVDGGRVVALGTEVDRTATADAVVHDLGGMLVLAALAEPHAHLDKALSGRLIANPSGDLLGAINAWRNALPTMTIDDIARRAGEALELYLANGVTAIRTHVDVGAEIGMRGVAAIRRVKEAAAGRVDVQICALAMFPLTGSEGAANRAALRAAIDLGIDVVGGAPALDPDPAGNIAVALAAASDAGLPVDLHVDETLDAGVQSLDELTRQVEMVGFPHRVTASHCVSLGTRPLEEQRRVAARLAEAGVGVVTNPQTNLFLQGREHHVGTPRGLTAIAVLREAGVTVAGGGDNVQDPFNLVGRADPLETASLLVAAGHVLPEDAYDMVSINARAVLGLAPDPLAVGAPADLAAYRADSVRAVVAAGGDMRQTFKGGELVAVTERIVRIPGGKIIAHK